ncbi:MAG: hypothetical protein RL226_1306 [Bacteroidota bacterium]|jgi:dTDP-4-amino-4,6-dideoxygalactose transaminase
MADDRIPFSPPRVDEVTIAAVTEVLRSGWITSGPKVRALESGLETYIGQGAVIALNSWTNACELVLRWFGIGDGDEVILPAYTYAATANIVVHTGAKPVFVDVIPGTCEMDPVALQRALTVKTKAVMPVDIGGLPVQYDRIAAILEAHRAHFRPSNEVQEQLGRPLFLADAAHSFGGFYKVKPVGSHADVSGFSFHAVKNLTTAEGGALVFNLPSPFDNAAIRDRMRVSALHGQTKDAFSKTVSGGWRYDIVEAGYKCNLTDIHAAIGLVELGRYEESLLHRKHICSTYLDLFGDDARFTLPVLQNLDRTSSFHLFMLRITNATEEQRDRIIDRVLELGVSTNVHFQPLPLLSFYKNMGFDIQDFPHSYAYYRNEISLPVWFGLTDEHIQKVVYAVKQATSEIMG